MNQSYDVIIIGGGSMGIAAAYYVAKSGCKVAVLDRDTIPNETGSHHGQTRMMRFGYSEGESYVPLVKHAYELWRELEQQSNRSLYVQTGALLMGEEGSDFLNEVLHSSTTHSLPHEVLTASDIHDRWPEITLPETFKGVLDTLAGFFLSEECVQAYKELALKLGVDIFEGETVMHVNPVAEGIDVISEQRTLHAGKVIVTAGAWTHKLLPELKMPIQPIRKTIAWFEPKAENAFDSSSFPCVVFNTSFGLYYAFPDYKGAGFKIGRHDGGQLVEPEELNRTFGAYEEDEPELRQLLDVHVPKAAGTLKRGAVCIYDQSPDEDFIIDWHPTDERIILAGGFSGHGFKFASVIGKLLSEMALDQPLTHPIESFKLSRFR
ncbi:N-methyl-L-tryptophan oxidase [Alkalihalobacillus sp. FSL R5-0424]